MRTFISVIIVLSLLWLSGCKLRPTSSETQSGGETSGPKSTVLIEPKLDGEEISLLNTSLYSLRPTDLSKETIEAVAYNEILTEQTPYFQSYPARADREKLLTPGDQVTDKSSALLDYLSKLTVAAGMPDSVEDLHTANQALISELKADMLKHPQKYGMTVGEVNKIEDFTDIPFEFLFDRVITQNATFASRIGGGIAAFIYQVLASLTGSSRAWGIAIITSLGVEPTFTAAFTYATLKQLYVLHRYYSFVKGAKSYAVKHQLPWDPREHIFNPELVELDEYYKTRANRAWILGAIAGGLIKTGANRGNVEWVVRYLVKLSMDKNSQEAIDKGPLAERKAAKKPGEEVKAKDTKGRKFFANSPATRRVLKSIGNGTFKTYQFLMTPIQRIITSPDWGTFITKFIRVPAGLDKKVVTERLRDFTVNKVPFLGPHAIAFSLADYMVTSSLMNGSIYFLSHISGSILLDTHLSPGKSIELALVDNRSFNSDFVDSTREFVYPMCMHFVHNAKYMSDKVPTKRVKRRQQACLKLIAGLEGLKSTTQVKEFSPALYSSLTDPAQTYLSHDAVNKLITFAATKPYAYRVTWLGMLRSMFSLDMVPSQFWTLQHRLLINPENNEMTLDHEVDGLSGMKSVFTSLNTSEEIGQILNAERLYYAVELLSMKMTKMKFNQMVEKGYVEGEPITEEDDKRILENTPDLVDGFLNYFLHRKLKITKSLKQMASLAGEVNTREKTWLGDDIGRSMSSLFAEEGMILMKLPSRVRNWEEITRKEADQIMHVGQPRVGGLNQP